MSVDPLGEFPDAPTVAEQLYCSRAACITPEECWTRGRCGRIFRDDVQPDPGRHTRIRDSRAIRDKVREDRECRIFDCGDTATDPHHVLYRSLGGDDHPDAVVGVCRLHHDILHYSAKEDYWEVREALGAALTQAEIAYVLRRLGVVEGVSFLERAYRVSPDDLRIQVFKSTETTGESHVS